MQLNSAAATPYRTGYQHGEQAKAAVRHNVQAFFMQMEVAGYMPERVLSAAHDHAGLLERRRDELAGIADGARLPLEPVLTYNLYRELVSPDECTAMMAVGCASASGSTIYAKNSDKVGGESLVGPGFYRFKELNVVVYHELPNGLRIVGVTAAGTTGLKMGMNNRGLAGGGNLGRTEELYRRQVGLTEIRALDRTQLTRLALEQEDLHQALELIVGRTADTPFATSGINTVADARQAYIVEESYDRLAVKKVVDDVDARSNRFITLEYLNKKDDLSSLCRYYRALELLEANKGRITFQDMIAFSMDHVNGPGPNSICRHGADCHDEVSLSSMVMELNGTDPTLSRWAICLGKPCHAWREADGHISGDMRTTPGQIPTGFYDGQTFKQYYREQVRPA